jgi:hypothetical protein
VVNGEKMKRNNGRSKAMYGICRIDDELHRTFAWRVSLRRRGNGYVKNFPDKKWGGKGRALTAAKEYRDDLLSRHPPLSRKEFCSILRSNNKSGITGVYRYAKSFRLRDGRVKRSWYWEATWPVGNSEQNHRSFSVNDHGEVKARQLAIRAREAALENLDGYFWASERGAAS